MQPSTPTAPNDNARPEPAPGRQPTAGRWVGLWLAIGLSAATSARAAPTGDPAEELQLLMESGVELARGALLAGVGLRPFAFVMRSDGKVQRLVPSTSADPPADALLATLERGLQEQAASGELRGSAVFVDVVVAREGSEREALQARLEHVEGSCLDVFFLYRRDADGALHFDPPITRSRRGTIFATCAWPAVGDGALERYDPGAEAQPREGAASP